MRILGVSVHGVGGLKDANVNLPDSPVAALAGANGTGKSKFLACLLSPWTGAIPASRSANDFAEVSVHLAITDTEQSALQQLSHAMNWGDARPPESFSVIIRQNPPAGTQRDSVPPMPVLTQFAQYVPLLQAQPSLDVLFLPAERRLLPASTTGIDLNQLSDALAMQMTVNARGSVQSYGRLDDSEFEQFAKALCVAAQLADDPDDQPAGERPRIEWDVFVETVNSLIAPKRLLPLTKRHPENLRIATSDGYQHAVQDLSSGERQALIIISRILRAGSGHSVVLIDEPDAYLHPHLSRRLALALEQAVGPDGQLIVATHSPAVLDTVSPSSIIRLSHTDAPRLVVDESERLEVYREAGFRASALTQSDLLVITEGDSDATLLPLLLPDLARATLRSVGGRSSVLADVARLRPYALPVLGVVDGDVLPPAVPDVLADVVIVWEAGDIEGMFLSDDAALEVMVERGLVKSPYDSVASLRLLLDELLAAQQESLVAEVAQNLLRQRRGMEWPTPKGDRAIDRLRQAVQGMATPTESDLDSCLQEARELWAQNEGTLWRIVRGKYILPLFTQKASMMTGGQALLEAIARARPALSRLQPFREAVAEALGSCAPS